MTHPHPPSQLPQQIAGPLRGPGPGPLRRPHASHHSARAVTLVETVAALVILATLVAMALAAQSRLVKQWNDADLRLEAARVADDLISSWWELGITVPHKQSGQSATHPDWRWQTTPLEDQQLLNDHLEIVRVSIFAPPGSRYGNMPLCEIDLLTSLDVGGRK